MVSEVFTSILISPVCLYGVNPLAVTSSSYCPIDTTGKLKMPSSLLVVVWVTLVAVLVRVTLLPEITAPVASFTDPAILPLPVWARAVRLMNNASTRSTTNTPSGTSTVSRSARHPRGGRKPSSARGFEEYTQASSIKFRWFIVVSDVACLVGEQTHHECSGQTSRMVRQ